ncbi:putative signal transducing protein [Nonlabens ponticola]|uniref:DUF2007 domain-containing protein n=1 Tax=Nonlabens ponticola TaxID=2496866 RepID=A0A3S9MY13_9FLAO|nr:DUF2007 domain-containing protein [Nonlabens ponticola]AZQ44145.1 DUF2007 domain-containing protein [Nonlabens ponticola]
MQQEVKLISGSSTTINRIAQLLNEKNIATLIKDHTESARLAGFGAPPNDIELFVAQKDLPQAQKVIEEYRQ